MRYRNCRLDKESQILTVIVGLLCGLLTVRLPVSLYGAQRGSHTYCDQSTPPALTYIKIDAELIFIFRLEPTEQPHLYLFLYS